MACPIHHTVWNRGGPTFAIIRHSKRRKETVYMTTDRLAALRVRDELDRVAETAYLLGLKEARNVQRAKRLSPSVA